MNCLDGQDTVWAGVSSDSEGFDHHHKLRHLQGMILVTDKIGLALLLTEQGLLSCQADARRARSLDRQGSAEKLPRTPVPVDPKYAAAVRTEIRLTNLIWQGGYEVFALMSEFQDSDDFTTACTLADPMEHYVGGSMPPTEGLFLKVKKLPAAVTEAYTWWSRGYSSYDACPVW